MLSGKEMFPQHDLAYGLPSSKKGKIVSGNVREQNHVGESSVFFIFPQRDFAKL